MNKKLLLILVLLSLLVTTDAFARASKRLESPMTTTFATNAGALPSTTKVHDAIVNVGASRGWHVESDGPGKMRLHNLVRGKFDVVVDVSYDSHGMSVAYVSSENLNYEMEGGVAYIHPKYIEWIDLLLRDVGNRVRL